ncbi:MAG: cyclase family protein [Micromonosporaceae bacterium]|nr:cyclase family protein [Micromonosporaceae bacterium]
MVPGMPQSPNHPAYTHALVRRHGDTVRADGSSAANDILITGTHVGTHVDAVCHVSYRGRLYGGVEAAAALQGGRFSAYGVEQVSPMFCRGVLLDVPAALGGAGGCEPGYEITPADLAATVERQGTRPEPGDVVLVRSGWGRHWDDPVRYLGHKSGVPGVSEAGANWLAEQRVRAAGADTIAFERLAPGAGHAHLPAHRVLLVEHGINLIETMVLDELAAAGVHEFLFVAAPLPLVGATGSPVRPLAVVASGGSGQDG